MKKSLMFSLTWDSLFFYLIGMQYMTREESVDSCINRFQRINNIGQHI